MSSVIHWEPIDVLREVTICTEYIYQDLDYLLLDTVPSGLGIVHLNSLNLYLLVNQGKSASFTMGNLILLNSKRKLQTDNMFH